MCGGGAGAHDNINVMILIKLDYFSLNVPPSAPPHRPRIIRTRMNGNNSNNKTNLNSSR